jgi:HAD superfamily hydrolase (TIGR01509 family)
MIELLIFDFDGLILETEQPVFESWQELYTRYNCKLDLEMWGSIIGTAEGTFDPFAELESQAGRRLDRERLMAARRQRELDLVHAQEVLPGVREIIAEAQALDLKLAVASSSPQSWVEGHLKRLGLWENFDCIRTSSHVPRTKPAPDLFLAVLEALEIPASRAVVFEDSPNGILAAKRAGIFCVTVPNHLTRQLDVSLADLRLESLADIRLPELFEQIAQNGRKGGQPEGSL